MVFAKVAPKGCSRSPRLSTSWPRGAPWKGAGRVPGGGGSGLPSSRLGEAEPPLPSGPSSPREAPSPRPLGKHLWPSGSLRLAGARSFVCMSCFWPASSASFWSGRVCGSAQQPWGLWRSLACFSAMRLSIPSLPSLRMPLALLLPPSGQAPRKSSGPSPPLCVSPPAYTACRRRSPSPSWRCCPVPVRASGHTCLCFSCAPLPPRMSFFLLSPSPSCPPSVGTPPP